MLYYISAQLHAILDGVILEYLTRLLVTVLRSLQEIYQKTMFVSGFLI